MLKTMKKNTTYFANLEKRNYETNTINKLTINGKEINGIHSIINEEEKYYKKDSKNIYPQTTVK